MDATIGSSSAAFVLRQPSSHSIRNNRASPQTADPEAQRRRPTRSSRPLHSPARLATSHRFLPCILITSRVDELSCQALLIDGNQSYRLRLLLRDYWHDPDFAGRKAENERRTRFLSLTSDPEWHQTMVYPAVTPAELHKRQLEVTVWHHQYDGSLEFLGEFLLDLKGIREFYQR